MSSYTWVNAHFSPTGTTAKVARAVAYIQVGAAEILSGLMPRMGEL